MRCTEADQAATSVTSTVVDALAAVTDTDPLSLDPPLYEAVDGDALDALARGDARFRVQFEYGGHTVVVREGGTVEVDGAVYDSDAGVLERR